VMQKAAPFVIGTAHHFKHCTALRLHPCRAIPSVQRKADLMKRLAVDSR
jgi:hypothetical protein